MTHEDQKPWYASRAVWGGLIAIAAGIAGALGYTVSPDDQEQIALIVTSIAGSVGGAIAVYGRIRASKTVGK